MTEITYPRVLTRTRDSFSVELSRGGYIRFVMKGSCTDECWRTGVWEVVGDEVHRTCTCPPSLHHRLTPTWGLEVSGPLPRFFIEQIGEAFEVNERRGLAVWSLFCGTKSEADAYLAGLKTGMQLSK